MPDFSTPSFNHVFNEKVIFKARSAAERKMQEPQAPMGDTEWSICNKFGITDAEFRKWNGLPLSGHVTIHAGTEYIVGWKKKDFADQPIEDKKDEDPWMDAFSDVSEPVRVNPLPSWIYKQPQDLSPPKRNSYLKLASNLKPSIPLQDYIKSWEKPPGQDAGHGQIFRDTKGMRTIGYGHYIPDEEYPKWKDYDPEIGGFKYLTLADMDELFAEDLEERSAKHVRRLLGNLRLTQGQFDAIVDLVYHRGPSAPLKCGLSDYLQRTQNKNNDPDKIRACFHYYDYWDNRATGIREFNAGFKKRRNEELDMFFHGQYTLHV
jgi:GH24 family phage-related lysozyme (muramidase)